jgi:hypothetical protein
MKKMLFITMVLFCLSSCKLDNIPPNYVILIEGNVGTDLSENRPVRVINHHQPVVQTVRSDCTQFVLPTIKPPPGFVLASDVTSTKVIDQLITHIEILHKYIDKRDKLINDSYNSFLIHCKH